MKALTSSFEFPAKRDAHLLKLPFETLVTDAAGLGISDKPFNNGINGILLLW